MVIFPGFGKVDVVSGATMRSVAIMNAVEDAVHKTR